MANGTTTAGPTTTTATFPNAGRALLEGNPLWANLSTVRAGTATERSDAISMSAVGIFGAHGVLDDLAATFGVDPPCEGA